MRIQKKRIIILGKTINLLWKISHIYFLLIIVLSVLYGLTSPIAIYVWKNVINIVTLLIKSENKMSENIYTLTFYVIMYLIVKEFSVLSLAFLQYIQNIYNDYINKYITCIISKTLILYELKIYDDVNVYNEIEKANNETSSRSLSILQTLITSIQYTTSFLGTISILAHFQFSIVIGCILTSIPTFYISYKILSRLFDVYNSRCERSRFINSIKQIFTNAQSIKEIKIFDSGAYLIKRMEDIFKKNIQEDKKIQGKIIIENLGVAFIDNIFTIILKTWTILVGVSKKYDIGTILMYISAVDNIKESIQNLLSIISSAYEDCMYLESFFLICEQIPETSLNKNLNEDIKSIEFINVSFKYPGTENYVLKNINIKFEKGKKYALVGSNGSGKTTLIKLLCALYSPVEGKILINGKDVNEFNKRSIYKHIGAVFQDFVKYPLSIKENISISNIKELNNLSLINQIAEKVKIKNYVDNLKNGYDTQLKREWSDSIDLSGGQWQRIAIARIFMKKFDVLVLDELSSALDIVTERHIIDTLSLENQCNICVFITHRYIDTDIIDEIIVLNQGEIVQKGNHDILVKKEGIYKNMIEAQKNKINLQLGG